MKELKIVLGIFLSSFLLGLTVIVAILGYLILYGAILAVPLLVVYYIFHALGVV